MASGACTTCIHACMHSLLHTYIHVSSEIGQIANAELHADASEVGSPSLAARVTSRQFWNLANYVPKVQTHTHTHTHTSSDSKSCAHESQLQLNGLIGNLPANLSEFAGSQ